MLMGYDITEHLEEAKAACSKTYVNEDFPPMLIAHGTKDTMVFCQQSVDLYHALRMPEKMYSCIFFAAQTTAVPHSGPRK